MQHVKLGIHHLFMLVGLRLLGLFCPNRGKQIIMLTTLHARLVRDGVFHAETLTKLNASLSLANSDQALVLPASMYGRVWDPVKINAILKEINGTYDGETCLLYEDAQRVSKSIAELVPGWLRYDTVDAMAHDVMRLFYCKPARLC